MGMQVYQDVRPPSAKDWLLGWQLQRRVYQEQVLLLMTHSERAAATDEGDEVFLPELSLLGLLLATR